MSCGTCGDEKLVDSGGQNPDGSFINIPCPECSQHMKPEIIRMFGDLTVMVSKYLPDNTILISENLLKKIA